METIKTAENLEFDVIYADGTRKRVHEGILWEVTDDVLTIHLGTNRLAVMFATVEALLEAVDLLGLIPTLIDYLLESPKSGAAVKLFSIASGRKQAIFRLGQMDMRQAAVDMLLDLANGTQGLVCSTLIDAAQRIGKLGDADG